MAVPAKGRVRLRTSLGDVPLQGFMGLPVPPNPTNRQIIEGIAEKVRSYALSEKHWSTPGTPDEPGSATVSSLVDKRPVHLVIQAKEPWIARSSDSFGLKIEVVAEGSNYHRVGLLIDVDCGAGLIVPFGARAGTLEPPSNLSHRSSQEILVFIDKVLQGGQWSSDVTEEHLTSAITTEQLTSEPKKGHNAHIIRSPEMHTAQPEAVDVSQLTEARESAALELKSSLAAKQALIDETRLSMDGIVEALRDLGETWSGIGAVLGITGPTVKQRFTQEGRQSHRDKVRRQRSTQRQRED